MLIWASRALFGDPAPLRTLPRLLRAGVGRHALPYLLWARLSPRRSFLMPVRLLEGLGGQPYRQRRAVLNDGRGTPLWLTLVCYHFEVILWGSALLGIFLLVPDEMPRPDLLAALTETDSWPYWASAVAYMLVFSLMAPFYVCSGFALYLSRRTELEAWDLELSFRKARDHMRPAPDAPGRRRLSRGAAATLLAAGLLWPWPTPVGVALAEPPLDPSRAQTLIEEILEDDDFGSTREVGIWVPIDRDPAAVPDALSLPEWLGQLAVALAHILKWGLFGLAAIALALLTGRILRDWQPTGWRRGRRAETHAEPARVPLRSDDLPSDAAAAVRTLLQAGDRAGALSLLYRASIRHLIGLGISIPAGATEGECLGLARRRLGAGALGPLPRLAGEWQRLAYGNRIPSTDALEALLDEWRFWTSPRAGGGIEP